MYLSYDVGCDDYFIIFKLLYMAVVDVMYLLWSKVICNTLNHEMIFMGVFFIDWIDFNLHML